MLGYWLVENYNERTNNLNVGSHTIHISEEVINSLTGIPNGEVVVQGKRRSITNDQVVAEYIA